MKVTLHEGDSREVLKAMAERGERVHSVVCDPPYHLDSVVKRFGKKGSKAAKYGKDGAFGRQSKGFMGRKWDGADEQGTKIAQDPEFWKLVYDVMLPGAYIVAFSSSRTFGRMQVAMEDAGFITHPMIGWVFGSGMGKGTPTKLNDWEGWRYGTQARKPALEPIYIGQKPFSEKSGPANILKHGVGAVNIDACRVPTTEDLNGGAYAENGNRAPSQSLKATGMNQPGKTVGKEFVQPQGRYPANLIHDGSDEVIALFPESKGAKGAVKGTEPSAKTKSVYGDFAARLPSDRRDLGGSSARFFECYRPLCYTCDDSGWIVTNMSWDNPYGEQEQCPDCHGESDAPSPFVNQPITYHRKAAKKDRAGSSHPTVKPIDLIRSLVRHVTPPGGTVLDPFAGSGTTGQAAVDEGMTPILIEMEPEYASDIRRRLGLPVPVDPDFADLLGGEDECRYCADTGWFYGDKDLAIPCNCEHGDQHIAAEPNSTNCGSIDFEDILG